MLVKVHIVVAVSLFPLSTTTACYINSERDDISLAITPENSTYTEGTDILLSCTASSAAPNDGYAPVWILPYNNALDCPHGISNECNSSSHEVLDASFDNEHCQWTSSIIVKGFRKSQEGTYTCQVGNHERKIALQLLCKFTHNNNSIFSFESAYQWRQKNIML